MPEVCHRAGVRDRGGAGSAGGPALRPAAHRVPVALVGAGGGTQQHLDGPDLGGVNARPAVPAVDAG